MMGKSFIREHSRIISMMMICSICVTASAQSFDELRKQVSASPATQSEETINKLLTAGLTEGKPSQAIAETRKWLRQNLPKDPVLLCYAGRAAEQSGDWKGAVALYQQYIKEADLQSATADEAVYAVYTLLIHRLKDDASAYAFGSTEGHRVMVCPRARQYDDWYLNQAKQRKDLANVAKRLNACILAGFPNELLSTRYDDDFYWLFRQLDGYFDQRGGIVLSQGMHDACRDLAKNIKFNDELKHLIDFGAAVKHYNIRKVAGDDVEPPIAESKALLSRYPQHALWVQTAWAGGGNGRYYRSNPSKYWPHKADEKMAPILAALPKMSPHDANELLSTWNGYYDGGPEVSREKSVTEFLIANPSYMNQRNGPIALDKNWWDMTAEEASALAVHLDQNDRPTASMIRAMAAAGKDVNIDELIKAVTVTEAWRLPHQHDARSRLISQLLRAKMMNQEVAKRRDEITKKMLALNVTNHLPKDAKSDQKVNEFKKLWADYKSLSPRTVAVKDLISNLVSHTPEVIPLLLGDGSPQAQRIAKSWIDRGIQGSDPLWAQYMKFSAVNTNVYAPSFSMLAEHHRGLEEMKKRYPENCKPHPLESDLRQSVQDSLKSNKLEDWQLLTWINMQYPEDNQAQVELMKQVLASPAWSKISYSTKYGAKQWFESAVINQAEQKWLDAANANLLCKELINLPAEADASTTAAALRSSITGIRQSPKKLRLRGLDQLAAVDNAVLFDPKVYSLIMELADSLRADCYSKALGDKLMGHVFEKNDPVDLHRTAAFLCSHALLDHHKEPFPMIRDKADQLVETHPSAALALSRIASQMFSGERNARHFTDKEDLPKLKTISGKATLAMGLVVIPVAKNHPSYPIYQSQAEWLTGNEDSAWSLVRDNWQSFVTVHREMTVSYLMWVLQRTIYSRNEERQETLIKSLMSWSQEVGTPLSLEEKIEVEIAYGDIAMQMGQLRQAHEIYSRTEKKEAYQNTPLRHKATLRKANAERIAKDFDAALETLNELTLERVPEIWSEIRYSRAEVYYDSEEYDDAKDDIDSILTREPNHADAKILLGKVQLKRQKLMEATEVELGSSSSQKSLFPGEKLKVTLSDPTLAVSGAGTSIEVVVWATSGDKETFFLRQFGDSKTKFRGEVATALGEPKPDDNILQVIGDDKVYYAYSERFREKMNNLEAKQGGPIIIASDAVLMASTRKLLTEAEQRAADMAELMSKVKVTEWAGGDAKSAAKAEFAAQSLSANARAEAASNSNDYSEYNRYIASIAKPGNPIHVRVIDPDKSRTENIDELNVSVSSSSGDSIGRVVLKETGTHTGWFEGSISTAGAQALAFARNSEPGRNPNMVISPKADSYPAWRPVATKSEKPEFKVDLNDNVEVGELKITAKEEGAKLKRFAVLSGLNPQSLSVVAAYPFNQGKIDYPWYPSVVVMNDTDKLHMNNDRSVRDIGGMENHLRLGWLNQTYAQGFSANVSGPSKALPAEVLKKVKWQRQNRHHSSSVIYRFQGYFYEPAMVERRFKVSLGKYAIPKNTHPSVNHVPKFSIAVDGRVISKEDGSLDGKVSLKPGLHRFEIWGTGWAYNMGFGERSVRLETAIGESGELEEVTDDFFNPKTFPAAALDHRNSPAEIIGNQDGSEFTVKFAKGSRARILQLVFMDHEGSVPALNKLELKEPDGTVVLPVAEDFASLNKNETLEILTGDKIAVRYVDDRFVTKSKQRHERSLDVSFTDGRVAFADMKPRWDSRKQKDQPYFEPLVRFHHNKPLSFSVRDADMDVSVKPDKVKVKLESAVGGVKEFTAVETEDSSGLFELVVIPVTGKPTKENEFQVAKGGAIVGTYLDEENDRPGVPFERKTSIDHAYFVQPEFVIGHATVTPAEGVESPRTLLHSFERRDYDAPEDTKLASESVQPRWSIDHQMISQSNAPDGGFNVVHGQRMYIELVAPQAILGENANLTVFAQTDTGRRLAGMSNSADFNINAPGTIRMDGGINKHQWHADPNAGVPKLETYVTNKIPFNDNPNLDRVYLQIPIITEMLPEFGALTDEEKYDLSKQAQTSRRAAQYLEMVKRIGGLVVSPGENIHLGFKYNDESGQEKWLQATAKPISHPVFDIMEEDYRKPLTSAYVGETLNLRVVDLAADLTDDDDSVFVIMQAESGAKERVELRETGPHTGIFKAGVMLSYVKSNQVDEASEGLTPESIQAKGFPVVYGDKVASRYTDANGVSTETLMVSISKGADGAILPFSKTYEDEEIAMRTQFSLAEAYLEMAKRHRKLGQEEAAEIEYSNAKQLLSKAMNQFKDPETRAHAEYLLGNLTLEEADVTGEAELKETRYRAALSRFLTVTGSYPQTIHASKAQYKIATIYERLNEPEIAAQEYVKLAYKYPDSEFLAMSMLRLGTHFLKKASAYEKQAQPLLAKEEDKDAQFEGVALQKMAVREYVKTAQIFGRMQERFPSHEKAGQAGLRSGQSYMRAKRYKDALSAFKRVIAEQSYDGPDVRAQAIYWSGMCHIDTRQQMSAYSSFKRLTFDFPESKWAAYARGQLSQESMLKLETDLEIERLEAQQ